MPHYSWIRIWVAFLAGCIAALEDGKTFAALLVVIVELDLNLIQVGLLLFLFSLIAAVVGTAFGLLADRIGHLPSLLTGLSVSAADTFPGAAARRAEIEQTVDSLLVSSAVEIFGSWNYANLIVVGLAAIGLSCALLLRRHTWGLKDCARARQKRAPAPVRRQVAPRGR